MVMTLKQWSGKGMKLLARFSSKIPIKCKRNIITGEMCRAKEIINGTIAQFNSIAEDVIITLLSLNGYSIKVIPSFSVYFTQNYLKIR